MKKPRTKDVFNHESAALPTAALADMKPTQMTVGMREVDKKRILIRNKAAHKSSAIAEKYLDAHAIKIVRGPKGGLYIIDHHHLAAALLKEGYKTAPIDIVADLSGGSMEDFWQEMQRRQFVHPHDADGVEQPLSALPEKLADLQDDPYRSLAWYVRNAGGYDKVQTPFAEFLWADYFRTQIDAATLEKKFGQACRDALKLARTEAAAHLPGYKAPRRLAAAKKTRAPRPKRK